MVIQLCCDHDVDQSNGRDWPEIEAGGIDQQKRAYLEFTGPWDLFPKVGMGEVVNKCLGNTHTHSHI